MRVGSVVARNIDEVSLTVQEADMPVRLLLPATSGELFFVEGVGSLTNTTWDIRDLCLFAPVDKGAGVQDYSQALVQYLELYAEAVKENRCLGGLCTIESWTSSILPVPWADSTYWAVDVTLTVEEIN